MIPRVGAFVGLDVLELALLVSDGVELLAGAALVRGAPARHGNLPPQKAEQPEQALPLLGAPRNPFSQAGISLAIPALRWPEPAGRTSGSSDPRMGATRSV